MPLFFFCIFFFLCLGLRGVSTRDLVVMRIGYLLCCRVECSKTFVSRDCSFES